MATRSVIGIFNADETVTSIYCHHDGYPEGVGAELVKKFASEEAIRALIAGGDASSIVNEVEYYKGSKAGAALTHKGVEAFMRSARNCGAEYAYLYVGGAYTCFDICGMKMEVLSPASNG